MNAEILWKLKKRLKGISQEPPTAMLDASGNLVTTIEVLEKLTVDMYAERLISHRIKNHQKVHQKQRERLCEHLIK